MHSHHLGNFRHRLSNEGVSIWLHVFTGGDQSWMTKREQVADCYKRVFAGHPYFEDYTGEEETVIIPAFVDFANLGVAAFLSTSSAFLSTSKRSAGEIIGFAGCIPAAKCEATDFLLEQAAKLPRSLDHYMYMAELGVVEEFRGHHLGKRLIMARAAATMNAPHLNHSHLLVRTARYGSNSWPLYEPHGAAIIHGLIQTMDAHSTNSKERMFFEAELLPFTESLQKAVPQVA